MTLEAAGRNGAIKVRRPVYISRAVDPTMEFRPIRHRKLEQAILPPKEIRLAFGGRADNEINLLRALRDATSLLSNGSLVEMTIARLHPEGEFGVEGGQNVLALHEAPRDGTYIRQPRSTMMSRRKIGTEFLLMAGTASEVSHEATAFLVRRTPRGGGRILWPGNGGGTPRQT